MSIPARIKQARVRRGLSLRALAEEVGVSQTAINKYEKGINTPDSAMLRKLAKALDVRPGYFLRPVRVGVIEPVFRKKASLRKKEQYRIIEEIRDWLERTLDLLGIVEEESLRFESPKDFPYSVDTVEDIEQAAEVLREVWHIGRDPIENLTDVLEEHNVIVGTVEADEAFDACTFWAEEEPAPAKHAPDHDRGAGGGVPVMVTREGIPGDRQRFTLAHELGHLVLRIEGDLDDEKACHRFAGAFLAPAKTFRQDLGGKRKHLSLGELEILKQRYGLSMQALVRRAFDLRIISKGLCTRINKAFRMRGWHRNEPGDEFSEEKSSRVELLARRAVAEELISQRRAEELLEHSLESLESAALEPA